MLRFRRTAHAVAIVLSLAVTLELTAASAPVAAGAIQERVYPNWGELEVATTDLHAGGRAGWNVVVSRVYRSRTLGGTDFGMGWDSPILRRLRPLPDGKVEYRDGLGDLWTFTIDQVTRGYVSPPGLGQRLARGESGWSLIDTKWRITKFDELGRLTLEGDEFWQPYRNAGNRIAYLYGADGRLSVILDPFDRETTITYWSEADSETPGAFPGNIRAITDWRGRTVRYEYDRERATLLRVILPRLDSTAADSVIRYQYANTDENYNDALELGTNLVSITDPGATTPRLEVEYGSTGADRDKILLQRWGTGETVRFEYPSENAVRITDALGQVRDYTIANVPAVPRPQILQLVERAVPVSPTPFGSLPGATSPTSEEQPVSRDRVFRYSYHPNGQLQSTTLEGVRETSIDWKKPPQVADYVPTAITTKPAGDAAARLAKTAAAAAEPLTIRFAYHGEGEGGSWSSMGAYLSAITANGRRRELAEAHRDALAPVTKNDEITATRTSDAEGQLRTITSSGGTDPGSSGTNTAVEWYGADAPVHARGRQKSVRRGELTTHFEYPTPTRTIIRDARGIVTTVDVNDRDLPVRRTVAGPGLETDESWVWDLAGRLSESRRKQSGRTVTTRYSYDLLGRRTSVMTDNVAIDGSLQSVTTRTSWNVPQRRVVTTLPSGATITRHLDTLGRTSREEVFAGETGTIETRFQYDLDSNLVFATDGFEASAAAFDVLGRPVAALRQDGTLTSLDWDEWGNPLRAAVEDAAGEMISETESGYTEAGRLKEIIQRLGADGRARRTGLLWDGAGRTTGIGVSPVLPIGSNSASRAVSADLDPGAVRAFRMQFDSSSRLLESASGRGTAGSIEEILQRTRYGEFAGHLPGRVTSSDREGDLADMRQQYDTLGNPALVLSGNLTWQARFDEDSNLTSLQSPGVDPSTWNYDGLGNPTGAQHPEGGAEQYAWGPAGAMAGYTDPSAEVTRTESDLLGRPVRHTYPDGTVERFTYEGRRLASVTDRQGRTSVFGYNAKGQLEAIREQGGATLDELEYDAAGRLTVWRNRDSELRWDGFDAEGRPSRTIVQRYAGGSGFTTKDVALELVQEHEWNVHGERVRWTMPWHDGIDGGLPWTREVRESRDAAGNVVKVERTTSSGEADTMLTTDYRGPGRPIMRSLTTRCSTVGCAPARVDRSYMYEPQTGRLAGMEASANGLVIAGSRVAAFHGERLGSLDLLGFGSPRAASYHYDRRGRLATVMPDRRADAVATREGLSPADFRETTARGALVGGPAREAIAEKGITAPTVTGREAGFTELAGHRIGTIADEGGVRAVSYDGSLRRDDERFVYEFDHRERLVRLTEKPGDPGPLTVRRAIYVYDGNDRLLGRRAEYAALPAAGVMPEESDWKLEDRPDILAADGIPAEVTFGWDPVADRLVAVFDASGTMVRQIIHGSEAYDDPLEVAVATKPSPLDPSISIQRLYPILDEAGTGSLQAVVNETGEVVARWSAAGAYGEDDVVIAGPHVEEIARQARTNDDGTLAWVEVSVGVSEALDEVTIASGARLAATRTDGSVVRIAGAPMTSSNPGRLRWRLTAREWQTLVAPDEMGTAPELLSIAVTPTLRAAAWGDTAIAPPPEWATVLYPVRSSDEQPVEYRETLAGLASWLASIPSGTERFETLYTIPATAALGTPREAGALPDDPIRLLTLAPFHAHPWQEPISGQNYVRARWFDPETATWLTPDPMGYRDSSNLYAFAGGDPVNGRDPTGAQTNVKRLSGPSERITALDLVNAGWKVLRGETGVPHHPYASGEDVLAFKKGVSIVMSPAGEMFEVAEGEGTILFVDDKNHGRSKAYSATALNENFESGERLRKARELVETSEKLTDEERAIALRKLGASDFTRAVMAGAPESNVRGVGAKLIAKGIGFLPKNNLGKGLLALSVISIAMASNPMDAAFTELTWGGEPLNEDEHDDLDTFLVLSAVADELNRRNFIGPPAPAEPNRREGSGGR